jgi:hypothetical protein
VIAILGGTGTGLVWGWYGAGVGPPRRLRSIVALVVGVAALAGETVAVAGLAGAVAFGVALAAGVVLRVAWLSWLRRRVRRVPEGGT